jgi:hypothetical protein
MQRAAKVIQKLTRDIKQRDAEAEDARSAMQRAGGLVQKLTRAREQRETEVKSDISRAAARLETILRSDPPSGSAGEQRALRLTYRVMKRIDRELDAMGISRSAVDKAPRNPRRLAAPTRLERGALQALRESRPDLTVEVAAILRLFDRLEEGGFSAWPTLPNGFRAEMTTERAQSMLARYQRDLEDVLAHGA